MDAVLRAVVLYLILLVVFRVAGKRSLAQVTTFDFVLLLVISEATQNALLGSDYSITYALISIVTLVTVDMGLSLAQDRWPRIGPWLDDVPVLLVEHGRPIERAMKRSRISEAEVLQAARLSQGLERLAQVKYAVLEQTGEISIIPAE
jgi:uncharacterized membrane protein YcaP (DUF421 family)